MWFLDNFERIIKLPLQSYTRHYVELVYIIMFFNDSNMIDMLLNKFLQDDSFKISPTMSLIYVLL